jgi:hypothetical protein
MSALVAASRRTLASRQQPGYQQSPDMRTARMGQMPGNPGGYTQMPDPSGRGGYAVAYGDEPQAMEPGGFATRDGRGYEIASLPGYTPTRRGDGYSYGSDIAMGPPAPPQGIPRGKGGSSNPTRLTMAERAQLGMKVMSYAPDQAPQQSMQPPQLAQAQAPQTGPGGYEPNSIGDRPWTGSQMPAARQSWNNTYGLR